MPADVSLITALAELHRFGRVSGACLLFRDYIVANLFPFSDRKMNLICGTVVDMCDGYASASREVTEFYFGYDQGQLLVFVHGHARLIVLAEAGAEPDPVGEAARAFLRENAGALGGLEVSELTERIRLPEVKEKLPVASGNSFESRPTPEASVPDEAPESPAEWMVYREHLVALLSHVLGNLQSARLIDRVVKEHGYGRQSPLKADFTSVAHAVVDKVPNRSKRRSLRALVDELRVPSL